MPSTLTALFATAIHEARVADAEPTGLARAATMLVTAAGARRVSWRVVGHEVEACGVPIPGDFPGVATIRDVFGSHSTAELMLPAGLTATQWSDLARIYGSSRAIYPTAHHVRAAVTGAAPGAELVAGQATAAEEPEAEPSRDRTIRPDFADAVDPIRKGLVVDRETDRSDLSTVLDPLLDEGSAAVARYDWDRVAQVLLGMAALAQHSDEGSRAMVLRERRRIVPESALEHLVREYPNAGPGSVIGRAIETLGNDGIEAVLEVLAGKPAKAAHRQYLELLATLPGAETALLRTLASPRDHLVRDTIEALGRRRVEAAVSAIGPLLRHRNEEIRAAAWRALEQIGTEDAIRMLR